MSGSVSTRKGMLIAAYGLLILVGLALVYLGLHGTLPTIADVMLPVAYVGVILFLARFQMRAFPREQQHFTFRFSLRLRSLFKSIVCFVIAILWTLIVGSVTGDTRIGSALAVGPAILMVCIGGYFFVRSIPNPFQQ